MFSWAHLGLVVLGGALGTAARAGLLLVIPAPVAVPVINVAGAFLLGVLFGLLSRAAVRRRRAWQHFAGTGVLGGFTTYSALAVGALDPSGMAWALVTVLAGTAAAWAGLVVARARRRP